jgi:hypothetical protein
VPDVRYEDRKQDVVNQEDKIAMLGVLFGQGEVLVIVIVTAIVVFLIVYRRRKH